MTGKGDNVADKTADSGGQSDIVTVAEAAIRLGKSDRTIRRMIAAGKLATVTIGGALCVQLAGLDTPDKVTGASVHVADKTGQSDRHMSDTEAEALRDTIRRQDGEISYLRAMLDRVTLMLPAPGQNVTQAAQDPRESQGRRQPLLHTVLFWIVVVFAVLALVLWVFYPRTAAVPDWLKTGDELSLVKHSKHAVEWQKQA